VHEGGFTIRKDFQDHWRFFRPDGIAVPACGYIAHDAQAENVGLSLATLIRSAANPSARGVLPNWKISMIRAGASTGPDG
jgi:hypothetical protein